MNQHSTKGRGGRFTSVKGDKRPRVLPELPVVDNSTTFSSPTTESRLKIPKFTKQSEVKLPSYSAQNRSPNDYIIQAKSKPSTSAMRSMPHSITTSISFNNLENKVT